MNTCDFRVADDATTLYIGGNEINNDDDALTSGVVDVLGANSTLTVSNGNTEVGRGGAGTLNVNAGNYNQTNANLVLGQSVDTSGGLTNADQVANGTVTFSNGAQVTIGTAAATPGTGDSNTDSDINFNDGGGTLTQSGAATVVNVTRSINMSDEGGLTPNDGSNDSSKYTLDGGTLNVGYSSTGTLADANGSINVGNGADANATFEVNGGILNVSNQVRIGSSVRSTGTFNVTGGIVNIGDAGGAQDLSLDSNGTGGTANVNLSGGIIAISDDLLMGNSSATGASNLVVSGSAEVTLDVFQFRSGTATDTATIQGGSVTTTGSLEMNGGSGVNNHKLILDGSAGSFVVGGNILLDGSSELTFNIDSGGVTEIDGGDANLTISDAGGAANLVIDFSSSGLTSAYTLGRIQLISATGTLNGSFDSIAFEDTVETFGDGSRYVLENSDGSGVYLIAVPEAGAIAFLGFCVVGIAARRRRRI